MKAVPQRWELVCRVIDNYGDAGIAIRLARQLVNEYHKEVTLWIDHLPTLARLLKGVVAERDEQRCEGVLIRRLSNATTVPQRAPGAGGYWTDIIVDLFGAGLPEAWLADFAERFPRAVTATQPLAGLRHKASFPKPPLWLVFEYLSAENFVDAMHGLPSPPTNCDVPRFFFFPGYTQTSGGILRERSLFAQRNAAQWEPGLRVQLLQDLQVTLPAAVPQTALWVSLFCYDTPKLIDLMQAFAASPIPLVLLVPERVGEQAIRQWRTDYPQAGDNLYLLAIPFTDQQHYDRLLWACDLNFVRGEDSLTRALWAGRPFIWQAYVQPEDAHHEKVKAFLARYLEADINDPAAEFMASAGRDDVKACARAFAELMLWWNGINADLPQAQWQHLIKAFADWRCLARQRCEAIAEQSDLTTRLLAFAGEV